MQTPAEKLHLEVPGPEEMEELGRLLGEHCPAGQRIYLEGDLGAGKTTLVRGFLRGRGYQGKVKSPTYTLVEPYEFPDGTTVYHFDLYRLGDPEELEFMGIRDYFGDLSLCLVEWPERGRGALPGPDIVINIVAEDRGRRLGVTAATEKGGRVLAALAG